MVDKKDYNEVKDDFEKKIEDIKKLPGELNDKVDRIKWISPAIYWAITDDRDDAQEQLKKLVNTLKEVGEGILAPLLFIDYAANWQEISGNISMANNAHNNTEVSLEGHWDGKAYTRYKDSKDHQATALTTAADSGQKIHTE